MRKWVLSSSRFGFKVRTYEVPRHAILLEAVFDKACWLTGGWLGGHGMPQKLWEIPLGRPRYDDEGELENSIGHKFYNLEQAVYNYSFQREDKANAVEIDITAEQARAIDPKFVTDMEELDFLPDDYVSEKQLAEFYALRESGLSEAEAQGTVWPQAESNVVQFKKP